MEDAREPAVEHYPASTPAGDLFLRPGWSEKNLASVLEQMWQLQQKPSAQHFAAWSVQHWGSNMRSLAHTILTTPTLLFLC